MGLVITVSGAVGGVGATTFAYALALQAAEATVLIDAQSSGAPLDLVIGAEREVGTRWRQVHVTNPGIEADLVRSALPEFHGLRFLSSDRESAMQPIALLHLVESLREKNTVLVDIDVRSPMIESLQPDKRLLLVPNSIYGLGAALARPAMASAVIITEGLLADFTPDDLRGYLPQECVGVLKHERAVWQALRNATVPPRTCGLMQLAETIMHAE